MLRSFGGLLAGFAVALGLFLLMNGVIKLGVSKSEKRRSYKVVEFVRLRQESEVETKKRELPQKQAVQNQPAPPQMNMPSNSPSGGKLDAVELSVPTPQVENKVNLASSHSLGNVVSDADIIPLVRIQPMYPRSAAEKQIEGWVEVEFDITPQGTVANPRVVDAQPPNIFNQAALNAILKWKYKPQVRNGVPVVTRGVRVRLKFELEKS